MRTTLSLLSGLVCFVLVGCDPAVGPVLVNKTSRDLNVEAVFKDGHLVREVSARGEIWWLAYKKAPLAELRVFDGARLMHEITTDQANEFEANKKGDVLVLVIDDYAIRAVPRKLLRKLRLSDVENQ